MATGDIKPRWKKGESGNPKGRPKGSQNSKKRLERILLAIQTKKNPITGEMEQFTVIEQMDIAIISKALKGDIKAYSEILDRFEGKAKQLTETEVTNNNPIAINMYTAPPPTDEPTV